MNDCSIQALSSYTPWQVGQGNGLVLRQAMGTSGATMRGESRGGLGMKENDSAARNTRLAVAIGYRAREINKSGIEGHLSGWWGLFDRSGNRIAPSFEFRTRAEAFEKLGPKFDMDEYAKAILLKWLAEDDERWKRFLYCLMEVLPKPESDEDWRMYAKVFLLASPGWSHSLLNCRIRLMHMKRGSLERLTREWCSEGEP